VGFEKWRVRGAEGSVLISQLLSFGATWPVFSLGVRPSSRTSESSTGLEVSSRPYTRYPSPGMRQGRTRKVEAAGVGIGRQALASAGRRWHRQAEGRCSPTSAGVRRRPEPSLQRGCAIRSGSGPGRTPALSPPAGQLAPRVGGQQGTACQDRAQRHVSYIGLEPLPRGTATWPRGQRRSALPAAALPRRSWVATAAAV